MMGRSATGKLGRYSPGARPGFPYCSTVLGTITLGVVLALAGCGGTKKPAASPGGGAAPGAAEVVPAEQESAQKPGEKTSRAGGEPVAQKNGQKKSEKAGQQKDAAKGETAPAKPAPKKAPRPKMSGKARGHFEAGQKAFASGDLAGARKQFGAAINADKNAYQAYLAYGLVEQRRGKTGRAAESFKKALKVVPDYAPAISAYGVLLARQGSPERALSFLQQKANQYPGSAAILTAMAEAKSLQGRSGEAQSLAQEALKEDPDYKAAMVVLARDHYRGRRIDLALYALKGILDGYGKDNPPRDKDNAEAHLIRGLIYAERDMRGPAMEEMKAALAQRRDLVDAHMVLATYMLEAGNAKGAAKHLKMAIRYDNDNVTAHLQLGDAYRLLNRVADARRELEWVLEADPQLAGAHYNLGLLFLLSKKVPGMSKLQAANKAIEHFEAYKARAPRGGPDDVEELLTRAKTKKALIKAKQSEGAS